MHILSTSTHMRINTCTKVPVGTRTCAPACHTTCTQKAHVSTVCTRTRAHKNEHNTHTQAQANWTYRSLLQHVSKRRHAHAHELAAHNEGKVRHSGHHSNQLQKHRTRACNHCGEREKHKRKNKRLYKQPIRKK